MTAQEYIITSRLNKPTLPNGTHSTNQMEGD